MAIWQIALPGFCLRGGRGRRLREKPSPRSTRKKGYAALEMGEKERVAITYRNPVLGREHLP